jgi:hypothetical protein
MHQPDNPIFVNTTSRSQTWGKRLSPFFAGPCPLYSGAPCLEAKNVENAWQFSKVYPDHYPDHIGTDGDPTEAWHRWAKIGYLTERGIRYPVGRGAKPIYSWWDGKRLGYVESRKEIYIPLYSQAIHPLKEFRKLVELLKEHGEVVLWDFDGYDRKAAGKSLNDVIHDPSRPMGHSFVLEKMLREEVEDGNY